MAAFPDSRRLELAPLQFVLPESRRCLLDLFAGTGFVSGSLGRFFASTVLVEPHVEPAVADGRRLRRYQACALSASSFESLAGVDLAVCLAGLHHVLGPGSPEDRGSHRQQRLEAMRLWRSRLASGGRLVIADVPAPGTKTGWAEGPLDGLSNEPQSLRSGNIFFSVPDGLAEFTEALTCSRLRDYLARMTSLCQELGLGEAEPATFFDRVVSRLSPYGHVACFNSPWELADLFREAEFENVRAFVAPTPWLFPSKAEAVWFVHELLGIGQPCGTAEKLPTHEREPVEGGIFDYLGLRQLPDGFWVVSWKLMYVVGDRP